jgi:hypothetical protein
MKSSSPLAKPLALVLLVTTMVALSISPPAFGTMPDSTHSVNVSSIAPNDPLNFYKYFASSRWLNATFEDPAKRILSATPFKNVLAEKADKSFQYATDKNNIPIARNADGINVRFPIITANHLKILVLREKQLTQLEFERKSDTKSVLEISTAGQPSFIVTTKRDLSRPEEISMRLQFKNRRAELQIKNGELSLAKGEATRYEKLINELRANKVVSRSMDAGRIAASEGVLSGAMSLLPAYAVFDSLDCIIAAGECILTIGAYVGSISALIAACPETIGASCLAALLLHPVFAVMVAAKCADACRKCGITPPDPPTKAQFQQACIDFGSSWNESTQECNTLPLNLPPSGSCGGFSDWVTYPSTGCATGFTFFGGACQRSLQFQSRCADPTGYDPFSCTCPDGINTSPIVIDVDHKGFSMTNAAAGVVFNILNDGVPLKISWTAPDSTNAFLVLDRDGNGTIDNGTELFGNITPQPRAAQPNGFLALAEYDKPANGGNGNGRIDTGDAVFSQLRLWQDTNHNGISEPGELHELLQLGIRSIDLDFKKARWTDANGNRYLYRAKIYDLDGQHSGRWAWDVFLTAE